MRGGVEGGEVQGGAGRCREMQGGAVTDLTDPAGIWVGEAHLDYNR